MNYLAMNYMYVVFCSKRLTSFLPFASVVILFFWIKLSTSETKYTPGGIFEEDIYTVKKKKKKKKAIMFQQLLKPLGMNLGMQ